MSYLDQPLVSVLICAYNADKYIEECIDAILNQTYKNLEIVVVNDGSTDTTLSKLHYFAEKDPRIKIINNEENKGFIVSLNIGISSINGDYLARTDADDITKPEWIEKILGYMLSHPQIIAMGSYLTILSEDGNGSNLANYYEHGDEWRNPLSHREIVEAMLFRNPIHNNSMIVKSTVFREHGLRFDPAYQHTEDYQFWLEVSRLGELANYPESLVYYRLHNTQTSSLHNKYQNLMAKKIRKRAINYYLQDLGIIHRLGEDIFFHDIKTIQAELASLSLLDNCIIKRILYDCYLSLVDNKLINILYFLRDKNNSYFNRKQKIKIIKRIIRPYKYYSVL
ncbi:glycosyltransferase family 2 protein [Pasteurella multocida]|nr:glycosyltransferase family 2 protein [Pasteurella multocida]